MYNLALKSKKGRHEWNKACEKSNIYQRKQSTIIKTKSFSFKFDLTIISDSSFEPKSFKFYVFI